MLALEPIALALAVPVCFDEGRLRLPAFLGREPIFKMSIAHFAERGSKLVQLALEFITLGFQRDTLLTRRGGRGHSRMRFLMQ